MAATNSSHQRSTLLVKNILVSFLIKGWSAIVVFLMVPVTLHCLGEYKNGVWLTISSIMLWIDNMDIASRASNVLAPFATTMPWLVVGVLVLVVLCIPGVISEFMNLPP